MFIDSDTLRLFCLMLSALLPLMIVVTSSSSGGITYFIANYFPEPVYHGYRLLKAVILSLAVAYAIQSVFVLSDPGTALKHFGYWIAYLFFTATIPVAVMGDPVATWYGIGGFVNTAGDAFSGDLDL